MFTPHGHWWFRRRAGSARPGSVNSRVPAVGDALLGRGPRWTIDRNGRIAYGHGDEYVVDIRDVDGRISVRMRSSIPSRRVTSKEVETFRRWYPDSVRMHRLEPQLRRLAEKALSQILSSLPETWPAFDPLRFDAAARLWVRRPPSFDDSTAVWDVVGRRLTTWVGGRSPPR